MERTLLREIVAAGYDGLILEQYPAIIEQLVVMVETLSEQLANCRDIIAEYESYHTGE